MSKLSEHIDFLRKFYIPNKRLLLQYTRDIFAKHHVVNDFGVDMLVDDDGSNPMTPDQFITAVMGKGEPNRD